MSCLSYDIELWPECSAPKVNLLAQISTSWAHSNGHKKSREKPRNSFFCQNGGQNYFWFWFSAIFMFSTINWFVLAKSQNIFGALFEIFGVKVEKFKNYLNKLQELPIQNFLIFSSRCALYHCVKIHLLSFSNKLSTEVGVFRLS